MICALSSGLKKEEEKKIGHEAFLGFSMQGTSECGRCVRVFDVAIIFPIWCVFYVTTCKERKHSLKHEYLCLFSVFY